MSLTKTKPPFIIRLIMRLGMVGAFLLITAAGFCQKENSYLSISGNIFTEKAGARDVKVFVIQIKDSIQDTIKVIRPVSEKKKPVTGQYSFDLELNKMYKIVFQGDPLFQETRLLDVSTVLNGQEKERNYIIDRVNVNIWIGNETKKIGFISYDAMKKDFVLESSNQK